jgi:hypothetical protein
MRIRRIVAVAVVAALTAACSASDTSRDRSRRDEARVEALTVTGATGSDGAPDPEARIPGRPERLAQVLEDTVASRSDAVAAWTSGGGAQTWPVPEDVELWALYEQRIYRLLATKERLAKDVVQRLPKGVASQARLISGAGRALYEHTTPVRHVPDFRIRKPEPADVLLSYFREGEDRFHVAWEVLAAVMLVETRMGRIRSSSSSGAQGPMQFLPATWDAYGLGGDVRDPYDAVLAAANYLHASGAPRDYRRALYAYNPLDAYVTAVWSYAKAMMRTPSLYDAFYNWQVFVRTTHGDVRLSGPGLPV